MAVKVKIRIDLLALLIQDEPTDAKDKTPGQQREWLVDSATTYRPVPLGPCIITIIICTFNGRHDSS